jgi:hypothetical protein
VLDAVADAAEWGRELPAGQGLGIAFARYENAGAYLGAVAEVAVDEVTGVVTVTHFWIAHDCGLVVNPDGLTNQVVGNVIQAILLAPVMGPRGWSGHRALREIGEKRLSEESREALLGGNASAAYNCRDW